MVVASKIGPQDLPPEGGYASVRTERIKLRTLINWKKGLAFFLTTNVVGWFMYSWEHRNYRRNLTELRSARNVIHLFLTAERDRAFLKQLKKNRDDEAELMKDYPGWEVGTYFGEPVYKTVAKDTLIEPRMPEYAIHADPSDGIQFIRGWLRHLI